MGAGFCVWSDEGQSPFSVFVLKLVCKFLASETGAQKPSERPQMCLQHEGCSEHSPLSKYFYSANLQRDLELSEAKAFSFQTFLWS